ncbi:MAG: hypothetical protein CTY25_12105 [Methylobacterium sp.]|nr:MAG: hypothetical protein CTY25_12105 [Methylobacterium sp.]
MSTGIGHMWRHAPLWRMCVLASAGIFALFMFFPPLKHQPATKKEGQVQSQTQPQPQPAAQSWQRQSPAPAPTQQGQPGEWQVAPARPPQKSWEEMERERLEKAKIEDERFRAHLRSLDTLKPREPQESQKK